MQDGVSLQCVLKFNSLEDITVKPSAFQNFVKDLDRGDIISENQDARAVREHY